MRRIKLFFRQNYGYGPLIGLLITIAGVEAGYQGHPYWLTLLVGVGTSLIAAAFVTYLSPSSDETYQQFLALGIRELWPSRRDVPNDNWCAWLAKSSRTCTLLGVAHGEWRKDRKFEDSLKQCLGRGVEVKILFLDPNSALADVRAREEQRDTPGTIRESIRIIWETRTKRLDKDCRSRLRLYVYDSTPSSGATWIDDFMVVTHYLAGYPNRTSPAFRVHDLGEDSLFGVYKMNIERILDKRDDGSTVEITEGNVGQYT
jgi:hypothetical protein